MAQEPVPAYFFPSSNWRLPLLAFIVWASVIFYFHILCSMQFGGEHGDEPVGPQDGKQAAEAREDGKFALLNEGEELSSGSDTELEELYIIQVTETKNDYSTQNTIYSDVDVRQSTTTQIAETTSNPNTAEINVPASPDVQEDNNYLFNLIETTTKGGSDREQELLKGTLESNAVDN